MAAQASSAMNVRALFVKGLAKGCNERHLQTIFQQFGVVTDCQIARHRSGRSAGFAIVTFATHEQAMAALQAMDNSIFLGRRLNVRWYQPDFEGNGQADALCGLESQLLAQQLASLQLPVQRGVDARAGWMLGTGASLPGDLGLDEQQQGQSRWSALVNLWLNDYAEQDNILPGAAGLPALRCSFDGKAPTASAAAAARRPYGSTQDLVSLDCLDYSGLLVETAVPPTAQMPAGPPPLAPAPASSSSTTSSAMPTPKDASAEDPSSFGKSRLATKWSVHQRSTADSELPEESEEVLADVVLMPTAGNPAVNKPAVGSKPSPSSAPSPSTKPLPMPQLARWESFSSAVMEDELRRISLDDNLYDQHNRQAVVKPPHVVRPAQPMGAKMPSVPSRAHMPQQPMPRMGVLPAVNPAALGLDLHPAAHLVNVPPTMAFNNSLGSHPMDLANLQALAGQLNLGGPQQGLDLQAVSHQMCRAQQEYANALAQLANAQKQVLAAAAAMQTPVMPTTCTAAFAPAGVPLHQVPLFQGELSAVGGLNGLRSLF